MKTKICKKCGIEQNVSEFYKELTIKDNLFSNCKICCFKYNKKYLQDPKKREKMIKYQAEYYQNKRKAYRKTPEEMKKRSDYAKKEYNQRQGVREKRIKHSKKYYSPQENMERIRKRVRAYEKRPYVMQKRRKYMNNYLKIKRQTNPTFRLNNSMRTGIYISLKGNKKGRHWEYLIKYTLQELKTHMEKQFDSLMNWDNYGLYWHIDHIKPQSLFNFINPEDKEFKECWALQNLQPLEVIENIRKSNKYKENNNPIPSSH